MMRRGSFPSTAVICAGVSSFSRSGRGTGIGGGRGIASAGSPNVRSRRFSRRAILAAAAVPLFLIAMWVRTPSLPRTAGGVPQNGSERVDAGEGAARALERALADARERLEERATGALDAPSDAPAAFAFLATRAPSRQDESVVLFDGARPLAWSGEMRIDPDSLGAPLTASFTPFYTTLNVVKQRGARRA